MQNPALKCALKKLLEFRLERGAPLPGWHCEQAGANLVYIDRGRPNRRAGLEVQPVCDLLLRSRPHELRDHVRVEQDHDSKSGISMRMPRISAIGSSR